MTDHDKQYAIFIDIDGTLLPQSKSALIKNLETINKVRALGHTVYICTGRSVSYMPPAIVFENNFDGIIAGAGAYVKLRDLVIAKKLVPYEAVKKVCEYFIAHNVPGVLEGELNMFYFNEVTFTDKDNNWVYLDNSTVNKYITEDSPILKFTVDGMVPMAVMDILGEEFTLIQHAHFGEIVLKSCSKAFGIQAVLSALKIPREQSIAMGDSLNDLDMIEYAGIGVAMGNAIDEIKNAADFITQDVEDAGVSYALEKLFKLN